MVLQNNNKDVHYYTIEVLKCTQNTLTSNGYIISH